MDNPKSEVLKKYMFDLLKKGKILMISSLYHLKGYAVLYDQI